MVKLILVFLSISVYSFCDVLISNTGPCPCDLYPNLCDFDCCCDLQCTSDQQSLFSCSNMTTPQASVCIPGGLIFNNNTNITTNLFVDSNNNLCYYNDNYTLRNFYFSPPTWNSSAAVYQPPLIDVTINYNPNSSFQNLNYIVGSQLYTYSGTSSPGYLIISRSGPDGLCIDGQAVYYLQNEATTCTRQITNLANQCLNLPRPEDYFQPNMYLALFPQVLLQPFNETNLKNWINVTCTSGCNSTRVYSGSYCSDVISSVTYNITGTTTIQSLSIQFTLVAVSVNVSSISHSFTVNFFMTNFNSSSATRSGNPGYIQQMPVLVRFSNSLTSWNIPFGQYCDNPSSYDTVLFGVNTQSYCQIRSNTTSNLTSILSSKFPQSVAPFGNSSYADVLVPIFQDYSGNSSQLLAAITIYFVYARTGTLTLSQNQIIGAQISYIYKALRIPNDTIVISQSFIDNSKTEFDLARQIRQQKALDSVKTFMYLFYVENGQPQNGFIKTRFFTVAAVVVTYFHMAL